MKHILTVFLGIVFISNIIAQSNTNKSGPVIKFEKLTHDFGILEQSTIPDTYKFKFTNVGDAPLVLQKVTGSCECTTPEYSSKPIMPGESGHIKVGFKTEGHDGGSFSKTITVVTNAPQNAKTKIVFLSIKGKVKIKVNP